MTTPARRPRIVEAAFWSWLAAAVLLIVVGLMALTLGFDTLRASAPDDFTDDDVRSVVNLYRTTGVIAILIGVGTGFLAGQVRRRGDKRFRRAAVALSAVATLMLLLVSFSVGLLFLVPAVFLVAAAVMITRPAAQEWFDG